MRIHSSFVASIGLLAAAACRSADVSTVERFLEASQRRDLGEMARLSVVPMPTGFDAWTGLERAGHRREPFSLARLQGELMGVRETRRKRLAEMSASGAWDQAIERARAGFQARVAAIRAEQARLRSALARSVDSWAELSEFEGDEEISDVRVTLRWGSTTSQCTFTLKRFDLRHRDDGQRPASRWIVVAISDPGGRDDAPHTR